MGNSYSDKQIINSINNLLNSDDENVEEGYLSELLIDWNTIPYGVPSSCKKNLLVVIDGNFDLDEIFRQTLNHLTALCKNKTKHVLIYVGISIKAWQVSWFIYQNEFSLLEDKGIEIKIHFA